MNIKISKKRQSIIRILQDQVEKFIKETMRSRY